MAADPTLFDPDTPSITDPVWCWVCRTTRPIPPACGPACLEDTDRDART